MGAQTPPEQQPPPPNAKGLTPVQIGAGVGAAVTILVLLVVREESHAGEDGYLSNFYLGVWSAIGAMVGMAIVAVVRALVQRDDKSDLRDNQNTVGVKGAAVQPALLPESPTASNGSPILRVLAGLAALLFAGTPVLMALQGKAEVGNLVLMETLGVMFGWYAVRGRKGLPSFLTKKLGE